MRFVTRRVPQFRSEALPILRSYGFKMFLASSRITAHLLDLIHDFMKHRANMGFYWTRRE
jgi:hypothetical protein